MHGRHKFLALASIGLCFWLPSHAAVLIEHCVSAEACVTNQAGERQCQPQTVCWRIFEPTYGPPNFTDPIEYFPSISVPQKGLDTNLDAVMDCWKDITDMARVSSGFPLRNDGKTKHNGIDVVSDTANYGRGAPIRSLGAGYVTEAKYSTLNGNYVRVMQGDGNEATYIHLLSLAVKDGDKVGVGDLLGAMNCTGSCGPPDNIGTISNTHVHVQVRDGRSNKLLDPRDMYGGRNCVSRRNSGPPPPSGGVCGPRGCTHVP